MSSSRTPVALSELLLQTTAGEAQRWTGPDFLRPELTEAPPPQAPAAPPPGPTVAELEAIEAQAREAGYQAGLEQGRQAAATELAEHRQQLEQIFSALARPLDTLDRQVEAELTELALHIARQVVYRTIEAHPEYITETVQAALAALPLASRQIRIRLHPDDAALLGETEPAEARSWQLIADPGLHRGDVEVDSEMSHLDARVETRLSRLAETVRSSPAPAAHE